ncbi:hypothetical protein TNCV_2834991 [Trichonephila clavipes]|nr:hypothetical protein TNCV_2834991 [Trichonephila clavipes]
MCRKLKRFPVGVVVRKGGCQLRCHPHPLTMVQNCVVELLTSQSRSRTLTTRLPQRSDDRTSSNKVYGCDGLEVKVKDSSLARHGFEPSADEDLLSRGHHYR